MLLKEVMIPEGYPCCDIRKQVAMAYAYADAMIGFREDTAEETVDTD